MKRLKTTPLLLSVLGILQILVPLVIFPVCAKQLELTSGKTVPMKCHWFSIVIVVLGIMLVLQALPKLVLKATEAKAFAAFVTLLTGVATILFSTNLLIGVCGNSQMPCRMATLPAVVILGALTILISLVELWMCYRECKR